MELLLNSEEKQLINSYFRVNIDSIINTFIRLESIYNVLFDGEGNFLDQASSLRKYHETDYLLVIKSNFSQYKDCLDTYSSLIYYLHCEQNDFNNLLAESNSEKIFGYVSVLKRTLASFYNFLMNLFEKVILEKMPNIEKMLVFEACPIDLPLISSREEANKIKNIIIKNKAKVLPVIRYGTSPKIFSRTIKIRNIIGLHFCCHGAEDGSLYLMGDWGNHVHLDIDTFITELRSVIFSRKIDFFYFNCCNSEDIGNATFTNFKSSLINDGVCCHCGSNDNQLAISFSCGIYIKKFKYRKKFSISVNEEKDSYSHSVLTEENEYADNVVLFN